MEISDELPYLSEIVDDIPLIRSCHTDQFNHAPAQTFFQTGFAVPGRPSIGSWATYGLGCVTSDLPAFVVLSTGSGISGGSGLWSSGFLPSIHTGVRFRNQGDAILNTTNPAGVDATLQCETIGLVSKLNQKRLNATGDPAVPSFARACLLGRRMIERGMRFVNIFHEGWDAHSDIVENHKKTAKLPTKPVRHSSSTSNDDYC